MTLDDLLAVWGGGDVTGNFVTNTFNVDDGAANKERTEGDVVTEFFEHEDVAESAFEAEFVVDERD